MLSPRAPLFSVSLAFATGCLLGRDGVASITGALVLFYLAGVFWFVLARRENAALAAFYVFTICAGLAHTLLLGADIPIGEHFTNLAVLPATGARLHAVPVKVRSMGTFPVRAYAVV